MPENVILPPLDDKCQLELLQLRTDGSDEIWRVRYVLECRERQLRKALSELHDVSSEADPAGTLRELRLAQDTIRALEAENEDLKMRLKNGDM